MKLRPYQETAVASVIDDWDSGLSDVLGVMATGLGKTQVFLALLLRLLGDGKRAIVIAHTRDLIKQPLDRLQLMAPPGWEAAGWRGDGRTGRIGDGHDDYAAQITFCTFQALGYEHTTKGSDEKERRHLARYLMNGAPDYLIVDECFPAGTLIDGKPIETLRIGDMARSYDHTTGRVEYRPIVRLFRKAPQQLVRVSLENGHQIVCTPNHPFYTPSEGYIAAEHLTAQHEVWYAETTESGSPALHGVWGDRGMRRPGWPTTGTQGAGVLLRRMPRPLHEPTVIGTDGRNQPALCVGANAGAQPDAPPRRAQSGIRNVARNWARSDISRWQWAPAAGATAPSGRSPGMADGSDRAHAGTQDQPAAPADTLQGGYCASGDEDSYRGGRRIAHATGAPGAGREEDRALACTRVASVQVLERTGDGRFGGLCPDGYVYNIEVAGNHNYFAEGVLVHNCHHANAPMLLNLIRTLREVNPNLKHLGVTATPVRGDGDGLAKVYQRSKKTVSGASFLYDISFGVKQHFLSMPRGLEIATGISVKGVETRAGDYSPSQLAKRFDTDAGRAIIVSSYHLYGYGRRSIAFTASVKGAHDLAACFNDLSLIPPDLLCEAAVAGYRHLHGAEAEVDGAALIAEWAARPMRAIGVDGKTPDRERILNDFRRGLATGFEQAPYHVFVNCQVATEGFDAPGASCVLMCRPTRAQGAYIQMVGRGLRPAGADPDPERRGMAIAGEDCLVLDFVPKDGGSKLVLLGDVLGMPKKLRAAAKQLKEAETGEVQLGFTFDGSRFNTDGSPLEIIARRIEFLEDSAHVWDERDGWMTLSLGPGPDGLDRILVITPSAEDGAAALWGLWRRPIDGSEDPVTGRPRYGSWCKGRLAQGELVDLCALGEEKAARWGASTLTNKGRGWHKQPASDGQLKYLRKLMSPEERRQVGGHLTKQVAAALITHYQAREVLSFDISN